jgi:hypothetical protein
LDFTEFIVMAQDLVKLKGGGGAAISATAVFGSRLAASEGEPFRSLESIISIADKVGFHVHACIFRVYKHVYILIYIYMDPVDPSRNK